MICVMIVDASGQTHQGLDKVVKALFSDYFYPCLFATIALGLLAIAFEILKAVIRKQVRKHGAKRSR